MKDLDLENWYRKDIFNLYYQYDIPQISLCTPLEVEKVYKFAKSKGLSFYFCMCHIFCTALLKHEEFMIRSIKGRIVIEDGEFVDICALKTNDELFKIVTAKYYPDIKKFCIETAEILQHQNTFTKPLPDGTRRSQAIAYISCTPWFDYTHITHPQDVQRNSFVPRLSYDKIKFNEKGERFVNLSLQVNHAAIDGMLIAKFLDDIKSIINNL